MNIGYACICLGVENTNFRTCTKRFVTEELMKDIIAHNIKSLSHVIDYHHEYGIRLFRISSDLIPFGSSEFNPLSWQTLFRDEFAALGEKIRAYGMRVSMHPGQYTLLNAVDPMILERSLQDLSYHCDVLDLLGMDPSNKLVLHIGGVYGDKAAAIQRFYQQAKQLPNRIKARLVIENDDRYYTLEDVLSISARCDLPVIFDNLHHELNPSLPLLDERACMLLVQQTWKPRDGLMKIHYSQQDEQRRRGAHAPFLRGDQFLSFVKQLPDQIDVMLEIKDKNISALQALYLLKQLPFCASIVWERYRYLILRYTSTGYQRINANIHDLDAVAFFQMIQECMSLPLLREQAVICYRTMLADHQDQLSEKQVSSCARAITRFEQQVLSEQGLRSCFQRAAKELHRQYDYLFLYV